MDVCAQRLPHDKPVFGGCRLKTGRFVTFYYCDEDHTSVIVRGRAAMHKNGEFVLSVLWKFVVLCVCSYYGFLLVYVVCA
mmetsp:Transcript_33040/g.48239  ORF Transcript_33040/g.48239 Transcript_33040/m.48239 type:complete len:80 (+) Transcript_33040:438-677(+)